MANPQAENGHVDIAHGIVEALMKVNLSAYESRILWFILRKTYGWKKKTDWITLSQFSECTGLDRRLVHRALKGLSSKKMIVIYKNDTYKIKYGFQKDYDKWKLQTKKKTVINRDDGVSSKEMMKLSSKEIPTKETITKETITKEKRLFVATSIELQLAELLLKKIISRNPNFKRPDLQKWSLDIDRTIRIDKRDPETIRAVIEWCQEDDFWQNNILSTSKLRKQFDQLIMKMNSRETRVLSPKGRKTAERLERWMAQ